MMFIILILIILEAGDIMNDESKKDWTRV